MARISDILTSSSISMLSFDSRRGCDSSAYKHQSKRPHFFPRFCSFGEPFTLGSISLSLLFFFYTCSLPATHAIVEFQARHVLSKSAPVTERFRWHKDIPTTIKKSLDSVALLFICPETENSSAFFFRTIPYSRRRVGSRYCTRSRSFVRATCESGGL